MFTANVLTTNFVHVTAKKKALSSAVEVWILAVRVLDTLYQCLFLPGEISCIVTAHLHNSCLDHDFYALEQLQRLFRVNGSAETTLEWQPVASSPKILF